MIIVAKHKFNNSPRSGVYPTMPMIMMDQL
jgi:hypothetical protein